MVEFPGVFIHSVFGLPVLILYLTFLCFMLFGGAVWYFVRVACSVGVRWLPFLVLRDECVLTLCKKDEVGIKVILLSALSSTFIFHVV